MKYTKLAIERAEDLLYGQAPHPVRTRHGLIIGGGTVYPEINFTLPPMTVEADTMDKVRDHYQRIIHEVLGRAVELEVPGVVVEFETVPPLTEQPDWGFDIVRILLDGIEQHHAKSGLKGVLRVTPNDNREFIRPPVMRSGRYWDAMLELFDRSAEAGAELLSIESVGGKELHDEALMMGDIHQVLYALCVLGVRDMKFLWEHIAQIAARHKVHAAGDTACGFGNTAMVLAEQRMIPRVFAAVVRTVTAVRSLVAYECGAVGPGKDCGYENIILKAITGCPMAHEGKSATCAHLSPVGNVAAAACDTWSNESVQHIKLLGAMAPTCSLESLAYDCRLFNEAGKAGPAGRRQLRDWMVAGDVGLDPQAYVLSPASAIRLARAIVRESDHYRAGRAVALETVALLKEASAGTELKLADRERTWLDRLDETLQELPTDESAFIAMVQPTVDGSKYLPKEYGLA